MREEDGQTYQTALYIRLSREDGDKEESDSVGNQRKLLTEYLDNRKEFILYDVYVDDGCTGTNFDRPEFQRMLSDIEAGRVTCVMVKDLSRFGRDYIETGRYLERVFPNLGVRFLSLTDGIDSLKSAYDMLLPIKNIFNEQYARDISNKIQATMKAKQRAGEFIGAFPSYGYQKSPKDRNKLVVDEDAAEVVQRIFSLFIQGYGKQKIAKLLNEEGIPCPTEYKKMNGEHYRNGNCLSDTVYWSYSTVNSILQREIYLGKMVQGTKHQCMRSRQRAVEREKWIVVENTHEPIIDRETWEKAQELLNRRKREGKQEGKQNLFSGYIRCGDCGRPMTLNRWLLKDGTEKKIFYCGTYKRNGKGCCSPHTLPMEALEEIILADFRSILRENPNLEKLVQEQTDQNPGEKRKKVMGMEKAKGELLRVKRQKKVLYEDYREGLLQKEEYLSYKEDYQRKEELLQKQILRFEEKREEGEGKEGRGEWVKKLLEEKDVEKLDRPTVEAMIERIEVYENQKLRIIYCFTG